MTQVIVSRAQTKRYPVVKVTTVDPWSEANFRHVLCAELDVTSIIDKTGDRTFDMVIADHRDDAVAIVVDYMAKLPLVAAVAEYPGT